MILYVYNIHITYACIYHIYIIYYIIYTCYTYYMENDLLARHLYGACESATCDSSGETGANKSASPSSEGLSA